MAGKQLPDLAEEVEPGWKGVLLSLHRKVVFNNPDYEAVSVQESFGRLRVRLRDETPEMWRLIAEAEEASIRVCQYCGQSGMNQCIKDRWYTLCRTHRLERLMAYGDSGSDGEGG